MSSSRNVRRKCKNAADYYAFVYDSDESVDEVLDVPINYAEHRTYRDNAALDNNNAVVADDVNVDALPNLEAEAVISDDTQSNLSQSSMSYASDLMNEVSEAEEVDLSSNEESQEATALQDMGPQSLAEDLANFVVSTKISLVAANKLLRVLRKYHNELPLVINFNVRQFHEANKGSFKMTNKKPDNCLMLKDKSVILATNFLDDGVSKHIVGFRFLEKHEIYLYPLASSSLDEYHVRSLSENIEFWNFDDLFCKCVQIPASFPVNGREFFVFPLLH